MLSFGAAMMMAVIAFPEVLLYLLGGAYSGLHLELIIATATAVIATWGAFSWHINRARGWVKYQPYRVPVIVAGQIIMFLMLDFSTTQGVLSFGLATMMLDVLFQTLISTVGFFGQRKRMRLGSHA